MDIHVDFNVLKNAGQALEPSRTVRGAIGEQQLKWMEFWVAAAEVDAIWEQQLSTAQSWVAHVDKNDRQ